jgi:hypothetical protein
VPALAQVEHQVDALVDQITDLLPVMEVLAESFERRLGKRLHG